MPVIRMSSLELLSFEWVLVGMLRFPPWIPMDRFRFVMMLARYYIGKCVRLQVTDSVHNLHISKVL